MEFGNCKLCQQDRNLQDSHFFPASLYKAFKDPGSKSNAIAVADGIALETSRQVRGFVLCAHCERRFNERGETWIHRNISTSTGFPVREALSKATPIGERDGFKSYACAEVKEIDTAKLAYFGLSIFWRASLPTWRNINGKPMKGISLGRYAEPIRRFLLNDEALPPEVSITVTIWPEGGDAPPAIISTPVGGNQGSYWDHQFYIPGLTYKLFVGKRLPEHLRKICLVTSAQKMIFVSDKLAQDAMERFAVQSAASRPTGKLAARRREKG